MGLQRIRKGSINILIKKVIPRVMLIATVITTPTNAQIDIAQINLKTSFPPIFEEN